MTPRSAELGCGALNEFSNACTPPESIRVNWLRQLQVWYVCEVFRGMSRTDACLEMAGGHGDKEYVWR